MLFGFYLLAAVAASPVMVYHTHTDFVTVTVDANGAPAPTPTTIVTVVAAPAPKSTSSSNSAGNVVALAQQPTLNSFASGLLNYHNQVRSQHSAPAMQWDSTLASYAQNYLNNQNCVFAHSGGPYGENIAIGYSTPVAAATAWYDEYKSYNYNLGMFSDSTGHFTQMVWKASTHLGCAQVSCSDGAFVACEYYPRGNVIGQFIPNVLP